MVDASLRIRVERLLTGEVKMGDLLTLFLAARDICGGREAVKEIGDFTAHRAERTRGTTTRELRAFLSDLRFKYQHFDAFVPMDRLPSDFGDIMERSVHRLDPKHLRAETGLDLKAAAVVTQRLVARLRDNGSGGLRMDRPDDADERSLVSYFTTFASVRPAFSGERLAKEFTDTLLVNGLLHASERTTFNLMANVVALFGIVQMHGSRVTLEDGSLVELRAVAHNTQGHLAVGAFLIIPRTHNGKTLRILHGSPVYQTALPADDYCESPLCQRPFEGWWSRPLDISRDGKLALLDASSDLAHDSLGTRDANAGV